MKRTATMMFGSPAYDIGRNIVTQLRPHCNNQKMIFMKPITVLEYLCVSYVLETLSL